MFWRDKESIRNCEVSLVFWEEVSDQAICWVFSLQLLWVFNICSLFSFCQKKEIKCWCCPRTSGISSGSCWIWCICLKTKILSKACSFLFWFGFLKIKFTFLTVHQETLLLLELRLSILELCELSVSLFWKIFLCWHNGRGMQILT